MKVVTLRPEQTYALRQAVLWPDKPMAFVQVPEDAQGQHFGVLLDGEVVSVVSLFVQAGTARFRKFATVPGFQRRGIGSALLLHVLQAAAAQQVPLIWCDARLDAKAFYERFGMSQQGEVFFKEGIPYIKMQKELSARS